MSTPNDGGRAFPRPASESNYGSPAQVGMSLRDWFAGQASVHDLSQMIPQSLDELCAIIGVPVMEYKSDVHYLPFIVALRYRWADAMLAERAKGRP